MFCSDTTATVVTSVGTVTWAEIYLKVLIKKVTFSCLTNETKACLWFLYLSNFTSKSVHTILHALPEISSLLAVACFYLKVTMQYTKS